MYTINVLRNQNYIVFLGMRKHKITHSRHITNYLSTTWIIILRTHKIINCSKFYNFLKSLFIYVWLICYIHLTSMVVEWVWMQGHLMFARWSLGKFQVLLVLTHIYQYLLNYYRHWLKLHKNRLYLLKRLNIFS